MKQLQQMWERVSAFLPEILVVCIALLLRLPLLGGSFWLDEAAQALESARPLSEQLNIIPDFQPPLLHLITHFSMYISASEWWLRTTGALIPGIVTVWATFRLGKNLHSELVGTLAALLLATNSFHIYYSQELRPYSLAVMFAMLTWLIVISVWKDGYSKKGLIVFTVLSALGLYSTYLYPFVLLSQFLFAAMFIRHFFKEFLTSVSIAALAFVPWLPTFFKQLEAGQLLRKTIPGWDTVVSIPQFKAVPLTIGKFIYGVVPLEFNSLYVIPTLIIGILLLILWVSDLATEKQKDALDYTKGLTISFILPMIIIWIVSLFIPVIRPKRLLFLLPVLYLFMSYIVTPYLRRTTNSLRGGLALLFIVVIGLINIGGTIQYYTTPSLQRENWRALYREMNNQYPPGESVAVYAFPEPFAPMRWYDTNNYPSVSIGELHVDEVENLPEKLKVITNYKYVLVFDYLSDLTDPEKEVLATIKEFGYHEVDQLNYPNIGFVRVFIRDEVVAAQVK